MRRSTADQVRAIVVEAVSGLNGRFDAMNIRMDTLQGRMDTLIDAISDLRSNLGTHGHDE